MVALPEFQTSSSYVAGLAKALTQLGRLEAVIARAPAEAASMLKDPHAKRWWGAVESMQMVSAIAAEGGAALVREVGRRAVAESLSPIVRPLVTVLVAISGPSPAVLLSRWSQLTQAAVRNVHCEWKSTGPTSGTLDVTYSREVPPEYTELWDGGFAFVYEATRKEGEPTKSRHEGNRLHFELSWT